jgi:hypothetical protein
VFPGALLLWWPAETTMAEALLVSEAARVPAGKDPEAASFVR